MAKRWPEGAPRSARRFGLALATMLLAAFALRIVYVVAQPGFDPTFDRPVLDGAYYLDWGGSLREGSVGPRGAYYLAPLYPWLLAGFLRVFGEDFRLLYIVQQACSVVSAAMIAIVGRRRVGDGAGLAAGALVALYGPTLFFASVPVGETLAILLLTTALATGSGRGAMRAGAAGILSGAAALARPNLILVPAVWGLGALLDRRWGRAAAVVLGMTAVILPVTVRNLAVSGHAVPISSNMGITLYHGNGPGARGIYTPSAGFSGTVRDQRREATLLAGLMAGRPLDDVEADRWWAARAVRTRIEDPVGTLRLIGSRMLLLVADDEISLDYAPSLDRNPWAWAAPVSFAVLFGLSGASLIFLGVRGSGGRDLWSTAAICALTPLVFFVSSRYRLPCAVILCVPAGAIVAALFRRGGPHAWAWRGAVVASAATLAVASASVPTGFVATSAEAVARSNRAMAWKAAGDVQRAEVELHEAIGLEPDSVPAWFNLGVVLEGRGRIDEAESSYRRALGIDPTHAESAGNLGGILIRDGQHGAAVAVLRPGLRARPGHEVCRTNLIIALASLGNLEDAKAVAREGAALRVELDPGLLRSIGLASPEGAEPRAR